MTLDPLLFAVAIPAVLFAGISKGGFGSGAAFAAAPILALVVDPGAAIGLLLPLLMVMDAAALKAFWGEWDWPDTRRLALGGLPGVILGALFWQVANDDVIRLLIGGVSLAYVAFEIARARGAIRARRRSWPAPVGYAAGVAGGFTGFVSHAGGPIFAVYLLSQGLSKTAYQATTVGAFAAINVFKAIGYGIVGIFTVETLLADAFLVPVALLGTWLGVVAHRWIPERAFFAVTYVLLTVTGTKLIWDALT